MPFIKAGKIRPIGIASLSRIQSLPDVSTLHETARLRQADARLGEQRPSQAPYISYASS